MKGVEKLFISRTSCKTHLNEHQVEQSFRTIKQLFLFLDSFNPHLKTLPLLCPSILNCSITIFVQSEFRPCKGKIDHSFQMFFSVDQSMQKKYSPLKLGFLLKFTYPQCFSFSICLNEFTIYILSNTIYKHSVNCCKHATDQCKFLISRNSQPSKKGRDERFT